MEIFAVLWSTIFAFGPALLTSYPKVLVPMLVMALIIGWFSPQKHAVWLCLLLCMIASAAITAGLPVTGILVPFYVLAGYLIGKAARFMVKFPQ